MIRFSINALMNRTLAIYKRVPIFREWMERQKIYQCPHTKKNEFSSECPRDGRPLEPWIARKVQRTVCIIITKLCTRLQNPASSELWSCVLCKATVETSNDSHLLPGLKNAGKENNLDSNKKKQSAGLKCPGVFMLCEDNEEEILYTFGSGKLLIQRT